MFGVKVKDPLFDGKIPSLSISNSPAFLCPAGLQRMAEEFVKFPEQYEVNRQALEKAANSYLFCVELLEKPIMRFRKKIDFCRRAARAPGGFTKQLLNHKFFKISFIHAESSTSNAKHFLPRSFNDAPM